MVRQARIDFPGALQHIMVRGIEQRYIFKSLQNKTFLLKKLGKTLLETETKCFAFAVMDNHFHLLLQTGTTPLSRIMQSVLTSYAVTYNLKQNRKGKLYQNRFKSVLCDKEEYLLELVRYIHLNPVKIGKVKTISELDKNPWTGHSVLMGNREAEWMDRDEVLWHFGKTEQKAQASYREFVSEGVSEELAYDLSGGGLIRSLGGVWELAKKARKPKKEWEAGDERILGGGEFVEAVLEHEEEREQAAEEIKNAGLDFDNVLIKAAKVCGISQEELFRKRSRGAASNGRSLLCKWMVVDIGESLSKVGRRLDMRQQSVNAAVAKGKALERELGVSLL